ncbi:hypothetical protein Asp14428_72950 [Actinoplanes sp. NBRC 14428]|nr:hypothetical protein Asp14428_72950 [Actinoplanes sp. NBRC 14428]
MTSTADLPAPVLLWQRWATLAAALTPLGHEDVWSVGATGAHHDDGGGNWSHLALVEDGRAVLYGYDHEYSDTTYAEPALDLLAGAPDWLPWDDLARLAADDQLGYVLWYEGDGPWQRVAYPDDLDDGLRQTAGPVLGEGAVRQELEEFVFQWGRHTVDTPEERDAVRSAATRLLGGFTAEALGDLLGRLTGVPVDLPAGVAVAATAGLLPGTVVPRVPPGTPPARRRVRSLSESGHERLVWDAMRREPERPRPVPAPVPALDDLVAWLRGHAPAGDGRCSLLMYADSASTAAQEGEHPPEERPGDGWAASFAELSDLVRRLRDAEADEGHGRWLFLRIETTAGTVTVDRRYDGWPDWWADNGPSGPWLGNLRTEIGSREARWRPSWAPLLDPEVAYRPA